MPPTTPLYRQVAAKLRDAIRRGEYPPGSQLPTEQELCSRYGASRHTVRLALATLNNEGIITSTAGRGTFVRNVVALTYHAARAEAADRSEDEPADAYVSEVRAQGRRPSQSFEMRIVPASAEIAERLRINEEEATVVRGCLRYVDDQPWSIQDSYYPIDLAQQTGLLAPTDIPQGTIRVLAEHGHLEVGYIDEITTRMPTPEEARTLELGAGVPVLVYLRTAYTSDRPVRLTSTVFAGDRNRLVYELGKLDAAYRERDET